MGPWVLACLFGERYKATDIFVFLVCFRRGVVMAMIKYIFMLLALMFTLSSCGDTDDELTFPVADAGSDQIVAVGVQVALDGSNSTDPEGNVLSYPSSKGQRLAYRPDHQANAKACPPGNFGSRSSFQVAECHRQRDPRLGTP